jgi:hypothetical protein
MIKVVPFIETAGSEKYKEFLAKPFTIDMLYPVLNANSCETLFNGWKGKDMLSWHKFMNEEKYTLEFYSRYYVIKKEGQTFKANDSVSYRLPLPKTINDFISDMQRFGIQLYWTVWIDNNFEPNEFLRKDEIENYYSCLLNKMGKFNELL